MTQMLPLRLSASAINDFVECPYRYARVHVSRIENVAPVTLMVFGDIVHKALAEFMRRGGWGALSKLDLIALLRGYWRKEVYQDDDLSMVNFERAMEMLENFYDRPYPANVRQELGVERRLSWRHFHKGMMAMGRLDRTVLLENNVIEVLDYKTGYRVIEPDRLEREPQALFYRSLAADAYRRLEPTSIKVTYYFLARGLPVSVDYDVDTFNEGWERIEAVVNQIRMAHREVTAGVPVEFAFPLNRCERCERCPLNSHCRALDA